MTSEPSDMPHVFQKLRIKAVERQSLAAERLRAAELRQAAIQSQLSAGFTLCSTARIALTVNQVQSGSLAVEKARHTAEVVGVHLDEPNHVPDTSLPGLRGDLAQLQKEILILEERLSIRQG